MTDAELMRKIKTDHGAVLADVCATTTVPPQFFAALIANESGGDPHAKRFEGAVLVSLWKVLLGRTPAYGSISAAALKQFVAGLSAPPISSPQSLPADAFNRLDDLATSWGLTQIMGYHTLDHTLNIAGVDSLKTDVGVLIATARLLAQFAQRFQLDVTANHEELFRCWNTGRPDGKTFDPAYVTNGLTRMAIWTSLP